RTTESSVTKNLDDEVFGAPDDGALGIPDDAVFCIPDGQCSSPARTTMSLTRTLPFHRLRYKLRRLREIDVVVGHRRVGGEALEIGQQELDLGRVHAAEELPRRLVRLALGRAQLQQTLERGRATPGRDLGDDAAERGFVAVNAAAEHDE